jgi:hypothetical protein
MESVNSRVHQFFSEKAKETDFKGFLLLRICGYSSGHPLPEVWQVAFLDDGKNLDPCCIQPEDNFGCRWNGENEALDRLVLGIGTITDAGAAAIGVTPEQAKEACQKLYASMYENLILPAAPIQDAGPAWLPAARARLVWLAESLRTSERASPRLVRASLRGMLRPELPQPAVGLIAMAARIRATRNRRIHRDYRRARGFASEGGFSGAGRLVCALPLARLRDFHDHYRVVRDSCLSFHVRVPAGVDVGRERRGREGMVQTEPIIARAALQLRVPGTLRYSWVVMPPHIRPAQRRQPAEVLGAYECPSGFVQPVYIPAGQFKIHADRSRVMKSKRA